MSLQGYVNSEPLLHSARDVLAMLTTVSDSWVEKVLVLTSDSRTLVGTLLSCDQMTNLVRSCLFPDGIIFMLFISVLEIENHI
jgi:hypothetical protein